MKLVVQRVKHAQIKVDNKIIANINHGIVCFIGFTEGDQNKDFNKTVNKLTGLRIFEDEQGKMNLNLNQVSGELLIVPNFTLYADCSHGFRPSFINALTPNLANVCFNKFVEQTMKMFPATKSGIFGADMQISQINDGPITIIIEC